MGSVHQLAGSTTPAHQRHGEVSYYYVANQHWMKPCKRVFCPNSFVALAYLLHCEFTYMRISPMLTRGLEVRISPIGLDSRHCAEVANGLRVYVEAALHVEGASHPAKRARSASRDKHASMGNYCTPGFLLPYPHILWE